jgi:hypothetical protein
LDDEEPDDDELDEDGLLDAESEPVEADEPPSPEVVDDDESELAAFSRLRLRVP